MKRKIVINSFIQHIGWYDRSLMNRNTKPFMSIVKQITVSLTSIFIIISGYNCTNETTTNKTLHASGDPTIKVDFKAPSNWSNVGVSLWVEIDRFTNKSSGWAEIEYIALYRNDTLIAKIQSLDSLGSHTGTFNYDSEGSPVGPLSDHNRDYQMSDITMKNSFIHIIKPNSGFRELWVDRSPKPVLNGGDRIYSTAKVRTDGDGCTFIRVGIDFRENPYNENQIMARIPPDPGCNGYNDTLAMNGSMTNSKDWVTIFTNGKTNFCWPHME